VGRWCKASPFRAHPSQGYPSQEYRHHRRMRSPYYRFHGMNRLEGSCSKRQSKKNAFSANGTCCLSVIMIVTASKSLRQCVLMAVANSLSDWSVEMRLIFMHTNQLHSNMTAIIDEVRYNDGNPKQAHYYTSRVHHAVSMVSNSCGTGLSAAPASIPIGRTRNIFGRAIRLAWRRGS
jgi:hypothetical protein